MILLFFVSMLTVGASGAMPLATEPVGPDKDYLCIKAEKAGATVQLVKEEHPAPTLHVDIGAGAKVQLVKEEHPAPSLYKENGAGAKVQLATMQYVIRLRK